MFIFTKKEKLYKFVHKKYGEERTILVVARNETQAVKKLYQMTEDSSCKVENIIEFTEVIPKKGE